MTVSGLEGVMSTKEKILDAALTLFAENGYDGTSVEQIANNVNAASNIFSLVDMTPSNPLISISHTIANTY